MDLNELKELVTSKITQITNEDYKTSYSDESIALIDNEEFKHYLTEGFKDGSGGFYSLMTEACSALKPKHIVELGNREGLGILSIFESIKKYDDVKLTTIDIINDLRYVPDFIKNSEKVDFVFGDVLDHDTIEAVKNNGPIDMILFDTIHTEEQLRKEWNTYEPLLSDTALVLIDDIYHETKYKFFEKIKHDKIVDYKMHSTGFGIVFYKKPPEQSDEEFWEDMSQDEK